MSHCPNCQAPINEDFGFVTCSSCGSVVLVEMDGSLEGEYQEEPKEALLSSDWEEASSHEEVSSHEEDSSQWEEEENLINEAPPKEPVQEIHADWGEVMEEPSSISDKTEDEEGPDSGSSESVTKNNAEEHTLAKTKAWDEGSREEDDIFEPQVGEPSVREVSTNFSDISEYGNSEVSVASEGIFRFDVYIRGIDNSEILQAVREHLSDEKFMWDVGMLMESIQEGELSLKDLSPVKASIVVNRLKALLLEIHWEQHAIHQA